MREKISGVRKMTDTLTPLPFIPQIELYKEFKEFKSYRQFKSKGATTVSRAKQPQSQGLFSE